jgi:serine/threonine protein kinase
MYEVCGTPLTKMLCHTQGKFYRGERIYEVNQDPKLIGILEANDSQEFKAIIVKILQGLALLQLAGIVHSDLKSENVLVEMDYEAKRVKSVKIIDFGTSFDFKNINSRLELTTPEFMPHDVLDYLVQKQSNMLGMSVDRSQGSSKISQKMHPWSIDTWSLGIIILECLIGFPVWMSYKGRVTKGPKSSSQLMTGIFGVQGRMPNKISSSQKQIASNLTHFLKKTFGGNNMCLGQLYTNIEFVDFLDRLLHLNPLERPDPKLIMSH